MKKKFLRTLLILGIISGSLNADIIPAREAKKISETATKKVIENFMKDPKTKQAYIETENYVSKIIKKVAKEGFYNIVHVRIDDIDRELKNMKFNKLSKKQQDILKYLLKNKLQKLGYKIEKGKYDILGLDWWIAWN
jgi:hypothetical protein